MDLKAMPSTLVSGPQVADADPQLREKSPQYGQRDADDVAGVAVDALDEPAAEAVDGEGARDLHRFAGAHVRGDLRIGHIGEPHRRTRDRLGEVAPGFASAVDPDQAVSR